MRLTDTLCVPPLAAATGWASLNVDWGTPH